MLKFFSLGFTLVELLVAVAIIGILGSISYPLYSDYIDNIKIKTACMDIQNISTAIAKYYTDYQKYPDSLNEVGFGSYLDPWKNPYQYLNIQTAKGNGPMRKNRFLVPINSDFDLYSMGKDGQSVPPLTAKVSRDDVIRASDGAFIGLASNL